MANLTDVPTENLRTTYDAALEANQGHRLAAGQVTVEHGDGDVSACALTDVEAELVARARVD